MHLAFALLLVTQSDPEIGALLRALSEDSVDARARAADALLALDERAEKAIRAGIRDADAATRVRYEHVLWRILRARQRRKLIPPIRYVTHKADGRPLSEVLRAWSEQTGIPVNPEIDDRPVTVDLKEASPLEALDAIGRAARLMLPVQHYWLVDGDDRREVGPWVETAGPFRDRPCRHVRHYRVAIDFIQLARRTDFGGARRTASFGLAFDRPPDLHPDEVCVEITSLRDDQGRALKVWVDDAFRGGTGFEAPADDAKRLTFRGRVRLSWVTDRTDVSFDDPSKCAGSVREADGVRVALERYEECENPWTGEPSIRAVVKATAGADARLRQEMPSDEPEPGPLAGVWAVTEGGERVPFQHGYAPKPKGRVVALRVQCVVDRVYDGFDFELKDVPLPE